MSTMKNRVQLIGHLGQDPEIKTFDNGKMNCRFSVATNDQFKNDKGENSTDTNWHNVVVWGQMVKYAEKHLSKGKEVFVEGKLTSRSYTDKEGVKRYITEVVALELHLLSVKVENAEVPEVAF